jgi:protein-tyrosine phosphatase
MMFLLAVLSDAAAAQGTPVEREVALEGAVNFRDMGGYATIDYRRIAMKRIYRAGDLSTLTDKDMEELKRRKVYTVVDFRSERERLAAPDRLLPNASYTQAPVGNCNLGNLHAFTGSFSSGADAMLAFYSDVLLLKDACHPFFRSLLTLPDTSAIVIHCSDGKDRTGIAAALFLYILDIPMETIVVDYLATNICRKRANKDLLDSLVNRQGIEQKTANELVYASPLYLETMFGAIGRRYGSIDSFLYIELGMDEPTKLRLREKFLSGF